MEFTGHIIRKENLTRKDILKGIGGKEKRRVTSLTSLCKRMSEEEKRVIVKGQRLVEATKDR